MGAAKSGAYSSLLTHQPGPLWPMFRCRCRTATKKDPANQLQFAGYYAAKQQGYYRDIDLDEEIVADAQGREPVKEVM